MRLHSSRLLPRLRLGLAAGLLLGLLGCGDVRTGQVAQLSADDADDFNLYAPQAPRAALRNALVPMASAPAEARAPADGPAVPARSATAGRKIISSAFIDLVTEDLSKLEANLRQLIASSGGYVADSNRTGATGSNRSGSWKVRVPVDNFDTLLRGASGLGELVSTRSESEDVSAEYYDLDARATAKKVEEARLLKHLSDSTGRLEEILAVERELSRVRSEIEQMQGRLAQLGNLTSLATITVTAREIKNYVPPNPPSLAQRVGRTFDASVRQLARFGESVLLFAVALAPWSPLIVVGGLVAVWLLRRLARWVQAEWREVVASYRAAAAARTARANAGG